MIDWLTLHIPVLHTRLHGERWLRITPEGEISCEGEFPTRVAGSACQSVQASTVRLGEGGGEVLRVDGNPAKWLQGHNLTGSDDIRDLARRFVASVLRALDQDHAAARVLADQALDGWEIYRVDVTRMYDVGTGLSDVHQWIQAAERRARVRYHGRGVFRGATLYFGKHSRYWSLKAYPKGDELAAKRHHLGDYPWGAEAVAWAQNKLRIEAVFRRMWLKYRGLHTLSAWNRETVAMVYDWALSRVDLVGNMRLSAEHLDELPPRLAMAVRAWQSGYDVLADLPRSTAYRYRRELLEFGIDLASPPAEGGEVVALVRTLEAVEAADPWWAQSSNCG